MAEQQFLEGMMSKPIAAIHLAAESFANCREARRYAEKKEDESKERLIAAMREAGESDYERSGLHVALETNYRVTVEFTAEEIDEEEGIE